MGVDAVAWPGTVEQAEALFDEMPPTLAGMRLKRPHVFGHSAGVVYRGAGENVIAWVMGTDKEITDPRGALGVMFNLAMACRKDTYVGTATPMRSGLGPGLGTEQGSANGDRGTWWFACSSVGEGSHTGHSVGWVSGDIGWLTTGSSRRTVAMVIETLEKAR